MFLTGTTILIFIGIALLATFFGYLMREDNTGTAQLLHVVGVVIFLFMGFQIFFNGIATQTGETVTNTLNNGTVTAATTTFAYDQTKDLYTQGLGILFILVGGTLGFFGYEDYQARKKAKEESIELT